MERRRRLAILLMAISAAAAAGLFLFLDRSAPPPKWLSDWPELADADPAICARIRAAWPAGQDGDFGAPKRDRLEPVLDAAGPGAGLALLRVILENDEGPGARFWHDGRTDRDDAIWWPGRWFAKQGGDLDDVLLRVLRDPERGPAVRRYALIGLLRPDCRVREGVFDVVLDPNVEPGLRADALVRLDRLGPTVPARFRDLLDLPWRGFDVMAAAVLALDGEPAAPSLLLSGLRWPRRFGTAQALLARAVRAITDDAPELRPLVEEMVGSRNHFRKDRDLAEAFAAWLKRHPERLDTPYERRRREYRDSARRKRELALGTFEEVLAAPESEVDFASASLLLANVGFDDLPREVWLDALDRFCGLLRRDLAGVEGREATLAVLARRFYLSRYHLNGWDPAERPSGLPDVFRQHDACCAGWTSLYVAVAERLDLPIVPVAAPGHVFVRWVDEDGARNVETTAGGVAFTDSEVRARCGDRIVELGKKELLARVLVDRSNELRDFSNELRGFGLGPEPELIEQAIRLDPEFPEAYLARAVLPEAAPEEALADAERALRLDGANAKALLVAGRSLAALGRSGEAVERLARASELAPEDDTIAVLRARCLFDLGRTDEALLVLDRALAARPDSNPIRTERMRIRILLGRDGWRADLAKLSPIPEDAPWARLEAAEALLTGNAFRSPDPAAAGELLAELAFLEKEPDAGPAGGMHLEVRPDEPIVPLEWHEEWRGLKERRAALIERIREMTGR